MKALFADGGFGLVGLILFFTLFIGVLLWVLWPGSREKFRRHGKIPLQDDGPEEH